MPIFAIATESTKLNCLGELGEGVDVNICANLIDTSKLKTIDCFKDIEDVNTDLPVSAACAQTMKPTLEIIKKN